MPLSVADRKTAGAAVAVELDPSYYLDGRGVGIGPFVGIPLYAPRAVRCKVIISAGSVAVSVPYYKRRSRVV